MPFMAKLNLIPRIQLLLFIRLYLTNRPHVLTSSE
jgi:hypothetical protein